MKPEIIRVVISLVESDPKLVTINSSRLLDSLGIDPVLVWFTAGL